MLKGRLEARNKRCLLFTQFFFGEEMKENSINVFPGKNNFEAAVFQSSSSIASS